MKEKRMIITIAGSTASGKTYLADLINSEIKKRTKLTSQVLGMDDWYKDLSNLSYEERKKVNFDHPNLIEHRLMQRNLEDLLNGAATKKPEYSFFTHNRKKTLVSAKPTDVIILEGLFALYFSYLQKRSDYKIFINMNDISFIKKKRIERDIEERNRTLNSVLEKLPLIGKMYSYFVRPTAVEADLVIDLSQKNYNKKYVYVPTVLAAVRDYFDVR